ncbi:unnamed protein product [Meganyctiphanes norvegica]|uniref:UFSP1/2/DUB catalytic domain-containing protein n=1 Tax=Meganyctiphanes norvegica TaxID=48144 RepID=A0AAV2Q5L0_MEGNR
MGGGRDYVCDLLANVHKDLATPTALVEVALVVGDYLYYHYGCDGFDDRGWGCGYRTLMTICSWIRGQLAKAPRDTDSGLTMGSSPPTVAPVPSNRRVQEILVEIGDKEGDFAASKQWIGSVEVGLVIDTLYDIPCKILHCNSGADLIKHIDTLFEHFKNKGAPVMMGGDVDNSSKGIVGVCKTDNECYLLVLDPHYWGEANDCSDLETSGWIKWQPLSQFVDCSFYNLCLPQLKAVQLQNQV